MIPKVIHYCWFGGKKIPAEFRRYMKSWRKFCPDYEIKEWNESNFDVFSHPFTKSAYEAKAWAFVSDYARLKVVYERGGIYLDTDVELLRKPDFLLENEFYIGVSQSEMLCATGLGYGAGKGNAVVAKMLAQYDGLLYSASNREAILCPKLNHAVIESLGYRQSEEPIKIGGALILPRRFLDPIAPGKSENLLCKDSVSVHHYAASWASSQTVLRRKLINAVGVERAQKLKHFLGE